MSDYVRQHAVSNRFDSSGSWVILSPVEQSIKRKIEAIGTPLKDWDISINYGIKTGANDAFIIDGAKRNELISADPKSAEIIRPILRGRDIKRYGFDFADQYIIATFPSKNYNIDDYPAVKEYLLSFGIERLEQSGKQYTINGEIVKSRKKTNNKWFETQDSISYWDDFSKQKILWGEISDIPKFMLDNSKDFCISNKAFLLTGNNLPELLLFLNSSLCQYYFSTIATTTGEGTVQWLKYKVELIPVPQFNQNISRMLISLEKAVDERGLTKDLDNKIDDLIYSLYHFTSNELDYIKSCIKK